MLGGTFQPVVCGALHRWKFENLQPAGEAVFERFLRFIRVTHLCVELSDVGSDFLLGLCLGFAGKHLAAFDALLVKVPDDALPAAICPPKNIAVCCETFLWHGWWFPPSGLFYQPPTLPYNACLCPPLVFKPGGEKLPRLLVDLHLPGAGNFSRAYSLFMRRNF